MFLQPLLQSPALHHPQEPTYTGKHLVTIVSSSPAQSASIILHDIEANPTVNPLHRQEERTDPIIEQYVREEAV
jgi:hypothetical protein